MLGQTDERSEEHRKDKAFFADAAFLRKSEKSRCEKNFVERTNLLTICRFFKTIFFILIGVFV